MSELGISFRRDSNGSITVANVLQNSLAGRDARIAPNDILIEINGRDVSSLPLSELMSSGLSGDTSAISLVMRRGDVVFDVSFSRGDSTHGTAQPPTNTAGIGILFRRDGEGRIVVRDCPLDGPAGRDGRIRAEDIILKVDDRPVTGLGMADLKGLVTGAPGTSVLLLVSRKDRYADSTFEVKLIRGIASYSGNGVGHERSMSPISVRSNASTTFVSPHTAGLGILFQQGPGGEFIVNNCPPDGPAGRDGRINTGDVVTQIDGREITGLDVNQLRELVQGPVGSTVRLALRRGTAHFEIQIIRGNTMNLNPDVDATPEERRELGPAMTQAADGGATGNSNAAGLGILFRQDTTGAIVVAGCSALGPAGRDGRISVGDVVTKINDTSVSGLTVSDLKDLIVGPPLSMVRLHLERMGEPLTVDLRREIVAPGAELESQISSRPDEATPSEEDAPLPDTNSNLLSIVNAFEINDSVQSGHHLEIAPDPDVTHKTPSLESVDDVSELKHSLSFPLDASGIENESQQSPRLMGSVTQSPMPPDLVSPSPVQFLLPGLPVKPVSEPAPEISEQDDDPLETVPEPDDSEKKSEVGSLSPLPQFNSILDKIPNTLPHLNPGSSLPSTLVPESPSSFFDSGQIHFNNDDYRSPPAPKIAPSVAAVSDPLLVVGPPPDPDVINSESPAPVHRKNTTVDHKKMWAMLADLTEALLRQKPADDVSFMIEWLRKQQDLSK